MESLAELVQFKPDTYGVRWNRHLAIFITTDDGVILIDPIGQFNPRAPLLVKECIAQITPQAVKYLVYSHWGGDHGMGAEAFADTATFVGHANIVERIKAATDPRSPVPTMMLDEPTSITLGGTKVDLYPMDLCPGDDYIAIHHPAQQFAMIVDEAQSRTIPYGKLHGAPAKVAERLKWAADTLDFDTLIAGHTGPTWSGTKDDIAEACQYYADLDAAVEAARQAGHADLSPELTVATKVALEPKYGTWSRFEQMIADNIEGSIRWNRGEVLR